MLNCQLFCPGSYRCCGAESSYELGYTVWQKNVALAGKSGQTAAAVPDSCCLEGSSAPGCGQAIFNHRKLEEHVTKIYVHGCVGAVKSVLKVRNRRSDKIRKVLSHRQKFRLKQTKLYCKNIATIETFGKKKFQIRYHMMGFNHS